MKNDFVHPIYLDYNATTPHDPEVITAMLPYIEEHFGNPSSTHAFGVRAKTAVETARGQVAELLNCLPEEIVFTSGGTESNNYAIKGLAFSLREKGNHIITTRVEHPAVTEVCGYLEKQGFTVTYLPVSEDCEVSVEEVERAVTRQTILISVMHANNEVGTIQPIERIAALARERGIATHTDAAQSVGKVPADVDALGVDMLSMAGHKLYAPKGVGALYIRRGVQLDKFMHGAGHERGMRAGTENVFSVAGLGKACEIARRDMAANALGMKATRDMLHKGLLERIKDVRLNGHAERRLPNTLSLGFRGVSAQRILSEMQERVAASAGSACHSGGVMVSATLRAMGVPVEWAMGTIRFSTGNMTTESDISSAVKIISEAEEALRNE